MTTAFEDEFATVDLLLRSDFETKAVDSFCLSWIKYERQLRRLVAFLLYQSDQLTTDDRANLRKALLDNSSIAHTDFRSAIFRLSGMSPDELFNDHYKRLRNALDQSYKVRQKVLHGQQSGLSLSRGDLQTRIEGIREWCRRLSDSCEREFGYDGFSRAGSLRKSVKTELSERVSVALKGASWEDFVRRL